MNTPLTTSVVAKTTAQKALMRAGIGLNSLEWRGGYAQMSEFQKRLFDQNNKGNASKDAK